MDRENLLMQFQDFTISYRFRLDFQIKSAGCEKKNFCEKFEEKKDKVNIGVLFYHSTAVHEFT